MFNPSARAKQQDGSFVGEFWDCYRLEPAQVQELRKFYEVHASNGGQPGLVIDLGGVTFAGSTALAGFVAMRRNGVRIVLFNVDENVREVFRVSGLEPLFGFAVDQAGAIRELMRLSGSDLSGTPSPDPVSPPSVARPTSGPLRRLKDKPS